MNKKAIEQCFPIVEINKLSIPERNAFKPIYQMHKWFARRSSCVFRAILLGALKPAFKNNSLVDGSLVDGSTNNQQQATDIMTEFYKNHSNDQDTNGKIILDPFMGGGTTIVEALRLGCNVIGNDLNPVAWFVVKTEVEPVDITELKQAFKNLENRDISYKDANNISRKDAKAQNNNVTLKEELLRHYKTECACCNETADIIYNFWVKSAVCTNPNCKKEVPLFKDYIVAQKIPSIKYFSETCPNCQKIFDLEIEPASLVGDIALMLPREKNKANAGDTRNKTRWTYSSDGNIICPHCEHSYYQKINFKAKKQKKKIDLSVILCPDCFAVFQWRGDLPDAITCPECKNINRPEEKSFNPKTGNIPQNGKFLCPHCGNVDAIINSIRQLPNKELLPMRPYAIQGYCPNCDTKTNEENKPLMNDLFDGLLVDGSLVVSSTSQPTTSKPINQQPATNNQLTHNCLLRHNNGKFFKRISAKDIETYKSVENEWNKIKNDKSHILYKYFPKSEIPVGEKTKSGLLAHHYYYWHQMFNPRQLYCLSLLLKCIDDEPNQIMKEMLLSALFYGLESYNMFTRYNFGGDKSEGVFARHDYQPKITVLEGNLWGTKYGKNSFSNSLEKILDGKYFCIKPYDREIVENNIEKIFIEEKIEKKSTDKILCSNSQDLSSVNKVDYVITDPPYADNVNYSELADFFYVWLRIILKNVYPHFAPEYTPKLDEIVENNTRGKSEKDFEDGLTNVWKQCYNKLDDEGLLIFTFHHSEGVKWILLLNSIFNAGYYLEAVYPIHSEATNSLHLQDKQSISYDLIHICKKRINPQPANPQPANPQPYSVIRREIRRRAKEEIKLIEEKGYGQEPLNPEDVNIILIGKCLELYSKNYGSIIDYKNDPVPIDKALSDVKMMVDILVNRQHPLSSELETSIDPITHIYLTTLCDRKEINSDEVHKITRGIIEVEKIIAAGIMTKGRAKRGRTYEVKHPSDRYAALKKYFNTKLEKSRQLSLFPEFEEERFQDIMLVDIIHFLMGAVMNNESIAAYLKEFEKVQSNVKTALQYLKQKNPTFTEPIDRILNLMEI